MAEPTNSDLAQAHLAELREALVSVPADVRDESAARPDTEQVTSQTPVWFDVMAAVLVMVGGFVIPAFGLIAGLAMVWISRTWKRSEKWIATLIPLSLISLVAVVWVMSWIAGRPAATDSGGEGMNPMISGQFDVMNFVVYFIFVIQVPVGIWLLIRAQRHWSKPVE